MGSLEIEGNGEHPLPREPYDLRRRAPAQPLAACYAPWVSVHVSAAGTVSPCRHFRGALSGAADSAAAALAGPGMEAVRTRFRDYRVRRSECAACVTHWEDGTAQDSPAVVEFDPLAPGDLAVPTLRALSVEVRGVLPAGLTVPSEEELAALRRLEVICDGPPDREVWTWLQEVLERCARRADRPPPELLLRFAGCVPEAGVLPEVARVVTVVHPMIAAAPGERFEAGLVQLGKDLAPRRTTLRLEVPVDRDNWIHLPAWRSLARRASAELIPELLSEPAERALGTLESDLVAAVHAALRRLTARFEAVAPAERGALERLFLRLRSAQERGAGQRGDDRLALPGLEHPLLEDEADALALLEGLLRAYHAPRLDAWFRQLVQHDGFADLARRRRSLRLVALWWTSSFEHQDGLAVLAQVFEDRARAATLVAADREALEGTPWEGWYEGWIHAFFPNRFAPRTEPYPRAPARPVPATYRPEITVLIPSYQHEAFIGRAVESVLAQTRGNLEVRVVDDGSTDGTVEAASACDDPRVKVSRNPGNLGLGPSLANALEQVSTEYVAVLNSDDVFHPERLERCLDALEADPHRELIATGLSPIDSEGLVCTARNTSLLFDGRNVFDWLQWYEQSGAGARTPGEVPLERLLERNFLLTSSNLVGRRAFLQRHRALWSRLEFCLDWQLFLLAAADGALHCLPEPLVGYRLHGGNTVWFDEERAWRYYVEVNQVAAGALLRLILDSAHGQDRTRRVVAIVADHLQRNSAIDWAGVCLGLYLNYEGLVARDLESAALSREMRELCAAQKQRLRARDLHREFGSDPGLLYRMRGEHGFLEQTRSLHEVLQDRFAAQQGELLGALADRKNLEELWHQAERERDQESSGKAPLYQEIGRLEGEVGRYRREQDEKQRALEKTDAELRQRDLELSQVRAELEEDRARLVTLKQARDDFEELSLRYARERDQVKASPEFRAGSLLLDRFRLRRPLRAAELAGMRVQAGWNLARMALDRRRTRPYRAVATACWNFPIWSQTFVYQELTQLVRRGIALRFVYSKLEPRDHLPDQFAALWTGKRKLVLDRKLQDRDVARYERRMPERLAALRRMVCDASGLSEEQLTGHDNYRQALSYTRLVEAFGADYLHSYFFYDRSFMSLVAAYLLDLPRGVSCYADHLMNDYDLKLVPLHLRLCDLVIATSARIKDELLGLAPTIDPDKILVKPNAINSERFPFLERRDPAPGEPFRLVCVNRIEPKKGLIDLVDAVRLLRERGFPVELHIVGDADHGIASSENYRQALVQQITGASLWGTVHLEGRQNEEGVRRFLSLSQLFIAPFVETERGDKDGIPTALLEGMACGTPVVATNAGSIGEVVEDGVQGVIVPQRQPAALAEAIRGLLEDPARRARMGQAAMRRIHESFDVKKCEAVFHDRLFQVLEARAASRRRPR